MVRYNLKLKNGDVINTITANSYEEAIEIFFVLGFLESTCK